MLIACYPGYLGTTQFTRGIPRIFRRDDDLFFFKASSTKISKALSQWHFHLKLKEISWIKDIYQSAQDWLLEHDALDMSKNEMFCHLIGIGNLYSQCMGHIWSVTISKDCKYCVSAQMKK